jgi:GxxExxY protein
MPIEVATPIRVLDQEEFHALNRRVMAIVFEVHNEFGRLLDELLFKREIAARCEAAGIVPAQREVQVRVTHEGFCKDYFLDLLFCHGLLLEAKTAERFTPAHRAQDLNYLLLTGMQHGMLVNLRPERVQHEFISTQLTPEKRRRFTVVDKGWCATEERSTQLREKVVALLKDWGGFLEIGLYREALTHFLGGPEAVIQAVPVYFGERLLGHQRVHLLDAKTGFALTALTGDRRNLEDHQRRFLCHTPLEALQWVNLNHHQIEFSTLRRA